MKNALTKTFAVILISITGILLLPAQTNAPDSGRDSNSIAAPAESPANTNTVSMSNAIAASHSISQKSSDNSVQIDASGVHFGAGSSGNALGLGKTLIALLAVAGPVILIFGLPVAILAIVFYSQHSRNKMMHETVRAMVEKGIPVTPELIAGLDRRGIKADIRLKAGTGSSRNRHLLPGLILVALGGGLALVNAAKVGIIVLFVGLAFLIVWLVERRNNNDAGSPSDTTGEGIPAAERKRTSDNQPPQI